MSKKRMNRITRTYTHHFQGSMGEVFPLLCPVREHDYLEDWKADILYSESGVAEKGCIFQTFNPAKSSDPGESCDILGSRTTWIITVHDASAGVVEFVMFTPDSHVSQLYIQLHPIDENPHSGGSPDHGGDGFCSAIFTYTHTAISDIGREFLQQFTRELFDQKMAGFEKSLSQYLENLRSSR